MVKARIGDVICLGLTKENIEQLQQSNPVYIDLTTMGAQGKLLICYGEDMQAAMSSLQTATGVDFPKIDPTKMGMYDGKGRRVDQ